MEREKDADTLDRALHPHRSERGEGPVRRRLRDLGGVNAMVVGAFAEHSADVHELVDELAAAGAHKAAQKYLMPAHRAKGATKALLYAAFGAWTGMEGALGAPTPPAGLHRSARAQAGGRRRSRSNTPACRRAQWSAHRGSSAAPGEPVWPALIRLRKRYVRMAHGFVVDNHTLGGR